jgi:broad specificity phosphatase PhoE
MIYLLTEPPNTLEAKGRVLGNYPAHWNKAAKNLLREVCQQLKDKGVQYAYFSDLDADAGHIVATELNIPFQREHGLRRFNAGRHHGGKLDYFQGILEQLIPKWRNNDSIPVRGGDSLISFKKRFLTKINKLIDSEEISVVVVGIMEARAVLNDDPKFWCFPTSKVSHGKIYVVKRESKKTHEDLHGMQTVSTMRKEFHSQSVGI